jgi:HD-GYP domain-containing protein (c-di-GMP phosphodiesterase class II)
LPLRQLLNFTSTAAPWLNVARLALLRIDAADTLQLVAMKEPLEVDSDWRSNQQTRPMRDIDAQILAAARNLKRGESLEFDEIIINDVSYAVALTAMNNEGNAWLALLSPHSAVEAAVANALTVVEMQRQTTLQQYFIGTLALVLLIIPVALYFANRVTAPLIRMSATAENLANGQLSSRTGVQRADEIGQLSGSIDRMADSIEQLQKEQEQAYRDMISTLTRALVKKDPYTAGHSGRVTKYALNLGRRIGLDEATLEKLRFGSITHDLGKIGIADAVLNKPTPLDEAEFEIMKQHPSFSRMIMKPLVRFQEYAEIAGAHHEHWDGTGYPDGLAGEDIHLLARIVAIADAWDAMIGDRIYRKGMSQEQAINILDTEKDNGQFDPALIREFIALIREELGSMVGSGL